MNAGAANIYTAEIAKLRQQVEDLQFTVRDLRRILKPARRFPPSWRLRQGQEAMLAVLVDNASTCVSHERIDAALSGVGRYDTTVGLRRKEVHAVRAVLSREVPKAEIKSVNRGGYYISIEHAALIKAAAARACGGQAMKPRGGNSVMASRQKVSAEEIAADPRADLDFMPTPPWGTRAFLQHVLQLDAEHGKHLSCWECCCGEGHMAEPLKEVFGTVYASDVYPHGYGDVGSFVGASGLDLGDVARCPFPPDWIITNPPFKLAYEMASRALTEARRGVALLLRTTWVEFGRALQALQPVRAALHGALR